METFAGRLKKLASREGVTPTELERKIGASKGVLTKAITNGTDVNSRWITAIAEKFPLWSIEWLITGEGEMLREQPEAVEAAPVISYSDGVPYYDVDFLLGFDELAAPSSETPDFMVRMPGYERATLWCNASGHSMEPEISNGDIIAMQRVADFSFLPYGDVYGFVTTNGMRTIKRLGRSTREGYYRLIPTNKEYDEQEIHVSQILHVYRVMGAMKSF